MTILVTGGTGLIGSAVCRLLVADGEPVRALVRPGSDSGALSGAGVRVVEGDITVADDVVRAADGCAAIVNSAAVLGGNAQQLDEQRATNIDGARHVFDAGAKHGVRVVTLSTTTFFRHDTPLTEDSPVDDASSDDPYTVTKRAAFIEAMQRAGAGQDIVVVVPGGTFGPGLSLSRSMGPTSYNRVIRGAINGKLTEYVRFPVPWVWADDVAACTIGALRRGRSGEKYLAFGAEDAQSTASFLRMACEVAGVRREIADVDVGPDTVARFGPSLAALGARRFPVPFFDNGRTRADLGYAPHQLRDGLEATVAWLRNAGQIGS